MIPICSGLIPALKKRVAIFSTVAASVLKNVYRWLEHNNNEVRPTLKNFSFPRYRVTKKNLMRAAGKKFFFHPFLDCTCCRITW